MGLGLCSESRSVRLRSLQNGSLQGLQARTCVAVHRSLTGTVVQPAQKVAVVTVLEHEPNTAASCGPNAAKRAACQACGGETRNISRRLLTPASPHAMNVPWIVISAVGNHCLSSSKRRIILYPGPYPRIGRHSGARCCLLPSPRPASWVWRTLGSFLCTRSNTTAGMLHGKTHC